MTEIEAFFREIDRLWKPPSRGNDVRAMIDRDLVQHGRLIERFRAAVDGFSMDSRAEDLSRCVANLHRVERDMLRVPESEIELPGWMQD